MTAVRGLKLISLNIEGKQHHNRILPFLKENEPDVICLQEVIEDDVQLIKDYTDMQAVRYVPLVRFNGPNNARMPEYAIWGELFLVKRKLSVSDISLQYYKRIGHELKDYNRDNLSFVDRACIASTVVKDETPYRVITTHFTWSPNGQATTDQESDMKQLLTLLESDIKQYKKGFVLCGDFNAPRGGKIWNMLSAVYADNIPTNTTTTLDPNLHKAGERLEDYVVDGLFSTPEYKLHDVQVTGGISDHKAISATIINKLADNQS